MDPKKDPNTKTVAESRRARFNDSIEDDLEAGIMLEGSEVKSLPTGQAAFTGGMRLPTAPLEEPARAGTRDAMRHAGPLN